MKNKCLRTTLAVGLLAATTVFANVNVFAAIEKTEKKINIIIDGEKLNLTDASPYVDAANRTMVPVRVVSENLGAKVIWNGATQEFEVTGTDIKNKKNVVVKGKANNPQVSVNGVKRYIDNNDNRVVVTYKGGRTYVPGRFFADTLGYNVRFEASTYTVYIDSDDVPVVPVGETYEKYNDPKKAIKEGLPKLGLESPVGSEAAILGKRGNQILVNNSNIDTKDEGNIAKIIVNGWNTPNKQDLPSVIMRNSQTMSKTKEVLHFYFGESDGNKVYATLDKAMNERKDVPLTKIGNKSFRIDGESSGVIVRVFD